MKIIKVKFKGDKDDISFTYDKEYEAKELSQERYGEDMYGIYDDSEDEYVYSLEYIKNNFEVVEK